MFKPPYRGNVSNGGGTTYRFFAPPLVWNNGAVLSESGTVVSVKTPNFKNIKRSDLPLNAFTYDYRLTTYSPGYAGQQGSSFAYSVGFVYGNIVLAVVVNPLLLPDYAEADRIARSKLLGKLQGASVNLAQSFAERGQTVNLLAKNVNRLASAALAIRRGKLKHAADLLGIKNTKANIRKDIPPSPKNLSNHWLEYSYGWRPLISDIYGSMELLAETYHMRKQTKVSASHSITYSRYSYLYRRAVSGPNVSSEIAQSTCIRTVRYVVYYSEDDAFAQIMSKTGLSNPLLLAWELIPYSFVVDWILPVGTYLKQMESTRGLSFRKGCRTLQGNDGHSTKWKASVADGNYYWIENCGMTHRNDQKVRVVLTSFPSPSLPNFRNLSQLGQVLSGLALLTQAFKR